MIRPLIDATREALFSLWRAVLRLPAEPPASGTGGAIG
jgi:hypothetical protein